MKIKAIEMTGFGRWSNQRFEGLANQQVFLGGNEAGKSTMQAFLLGMFFGFQRKSKKQPNAYEPRSGAQYGGAITIEEKGQDYRIERKGRQQSQLTITNLTTQTALSDPTAFLNQLFGPFTRENYEQIFSLTSADLATVATLTGPALEQKLLAYTKPEALAWQEYAAAQQQAAWQQYGKSKTAKKPLNLALQALTTTSERLAKQQGALDRYLAQDQALQRQRAQLRQLEKQRAALQQRQQHLQRLRPLWPAYEAWQGLQSASADQHPLITAEDEERVATLSRDQQFIQQKLAELAEQITAAKQDQPAVAVDPVLLGQLSQSLVQVTDLADHLQRRQAQLAALTERFTKELPDPLSASAIQAIRFLPWYRWAALFTLLLTGLAALFGQNGFAILLVMVTVCFGALTYFGQQQQRKVAAAYAPWPVGQAIQADIQSQVINGQLAQQSLPALQADLRTAEQDLVEAVQAYYQARPSAQQSAVPTTGPALQVLAKQCLQAGQQQEETSSGNLNELLKTQANYYQQKGTVNEQLTTLLARYQLPDLATFQEALQGQKQVARAKERQEDLAQQLTAADRTTLAQFTTLADLTEQEQAVQTALDQGAAAIQNLQDQVQDLQVSQRSLVSAEEQAGLSQQLANQKAALTEDFLQYLSQAVMPVVVDKVFYPQQGQQRAQIQAQTSRYFARLSKQHYQQVHLDSDQVRVLTADGLTFVAAELSTGARDQLYLALRLALVMVLAERYELPVLIDDALVNFDPGRRAVVLDLLTELAQKEQILFWTFDEQLAQGAVIDLEEKDGTS
ncbi:AAA family ATPase [Leuconostocaceae bacterium ESL0958]|nr:AAA family ATPase [Leuconostocaceae bacterium ESL0958]